MKQAAGLALALLLAASATPAASAATTGNGALALAALVGAHAPGLTSRDRRALASMLDGRLSFPFPAGRRIRVRAATVSCRASSVDIAEHSCTLSFAGHARTLHGRPAHELYATLIENGVTPDGAAGSTYEALSHLACTVTPSEVKQRGGGGARCTFGPD